MSKFKTQDVIRFLEGEMEEWERKAFQQELEVNVSLQEDIKLYKDISSTLKYNFCPDKEDLAFKSNLKDARQQYFLSKNAKFRVLSLQKYWYAAAVLIIALLVWAPWNKNLYEQYAVAEMVSVAERGDNSQQLLINATDRFNKENFEEAKEILKVLVAEKPDDHMLRFYYGISLLETNEIGLARENFNIVYSGESIFKNDAAFYNALSFLKEKNKERAKEWLLKVDKDADVFEKAQELIRKL